MNGAPGGLRVGDGLQVEQGAGWQVRGVVG
jgi:hypothetical protein